MAQFQDLPNELLFTVCQYLDSASLHSLSLTSTVLHDVSNVHLYRHITIGPLGQLVNTVVQNPILASYIRSLHCKIQGLDQVALHDAPGVPHTLLDVMGYGWTNDILFEILLVKACRLEKLTMDTNANFSDIQKV